MRPGDYLSQLAHRFGFDSAVVWAHPKNQDLRKLRANPEILEPGDILFIPTKPLEPQPFKSGTTNRYVGIPTLVKLKLVFKTGQVPLANRPYRIEGLGAPVEGTSDGDGAIELSVPVQRRELRVVFPEDNVFHTVKTGHMDPINGASGYRKRLAHLGFYGGGSGDFCDRLGEEHDREALLAFQIQKGLPATGTIDPDTAYALEREHKA